MPFTLLSYIVKGFISKGLRNLPLDVALVRLNAGHLLHLAAFTGMCGLMIHLLLYDETKKVDRCQIAGKSYMKCSDTNDVFNIKDIEYGAKFCRCLKSKQFPYCDGSHNGFNNGTPTDVYPLVISRRLDYPYFQHEAADDDDVFKESAVYKGSRVLIPHSSSSATNLTAHQYDAGGYGQDGGYGEMKYYKTAGYGEGDVEESGDKGGDEYFDERSDDSPIELYYSGEVEEASEPEDEEVVVYSNSESEDEVVYSSNDEVFHAVQGEEPETEEFEDNDGGGYFNNENYEVYARIMRNGREENPETDDDEDDEYEDIEEESEGIEEIFDGVRRLEGEELDTEDLEEEDGEF